MHALAFTDARPALNPSAGSPGRVAGRDTDYSTGATVFRFQTSFKLSINSRSALTVTPTYTVTTPGELPPSLYAPVRAALYCE